MQQYAVPQFIDVKEKIFGPMSFGQFGYVAAGGAICYLLFLTLDFWLFVVFAVPIMAFSAFLAFFQYNGQPASKYVTLVFRLITRPRIMVWRREYHPEKIQLATDTKKQEVNEPVKEYVSRSSLKKLAYVLDTEGGMSLEEVEKQKQEQAIEAKPMNADDRQKKIRELLGR